MTLNIFGTWVGLPAGEPRPQYVAAASQSFCGLPELASLPLAQVNQWVFKNIRYQSDTVDEWAPAQQTLERGYGDCEDHALLKRGILHWQGYSDDRLIFLIVNDLIQRQQHALLLVDQKFILDSRTYHVLPQERVQDYTPIKGYTLTETWIFGNERRS